MRPWRVTKSSTIPGQDAGSDERSVGGRTSLAPRGVDRTSRYPWACQASMARRSVLASWSQPQLRQNRKAPARCAVQRGHASRSASTRSTALAEGSEAPFRGLRSSLTVERVPIRFRRGGPGRIPPIAASGRERSAGLSAAGARASRRARGLLVPVRRVGSGIDPPDHRGCPRGSCGRAAVPVVEATGAYPSGRSVIPGRTGVRESTPGTRLPPVGFRSRSSIVGTSVIGY
jgi:hypothetical protein